jgi:hypothetical protein
MKCYIGIEEKECRVRGQFIYGEPFIESVRDVKTGVDVRGYLDAYTLDNLTKAWALAQEDNRE